MAQHRQNHQRRGDRQSAASQYGDIYQQVNERVMAALEAGARRVARGNLTPGLPRNGT